MMMMSCENQPFNVSSAGALAFVTAHKVKGPSQSDWWVLTAAHAARTNGLTCLPKHEGTRHYTFLITHPIHLCVSYSTFVIARRPRGYRAPHYSKSNWLRNLFCLLSVLLHPSFPQVQSYYIMYSQQHVTLYTCSSILALILFK
jgi:hypothetical protein